MLWKWLKFRKYQTIYKTSSPLDLLLSTVAIWCVTNKARFSWVFQSNSMGMIPHVMVLSYSMWTMMWNMKLNPLLMQIDSNLGFISELLPWVPYIPIIRFMNQVSILLNTSFFQCLLAMQLINIRWCYNCYGLHVDIVTTV